MAHYGLRARGRGTYFGAAWRKGIAGEEGEEDTSPVTEEEKAAAAAGMPARELTRQERRRFDKMLSERGGAERILTAR